MNKLKQLIKERAKIDARIDELESGDYKKIQIPYLKSRVGVCYAYRDNRYSGSETWDVYRKIVGLVETKSKNIVLLFEEHQITADGCAEIKTGSHLAYTSKSWYRTPPFTGFVEITEKEYNSERELCLKEMLTRQKLTKKVSE